MHIFPNFYLCKTLKSPEYLFYVNYSQKIHLKQRRIFSFNLTNSFKMCGEHFNSFTNIFVILIELKPASICNDAHTI